MARVLVLLGITKVRITGGEPLLRKGVVDFVRELRKLEPQGLKPQSVDAASGTSGTRALPGVAAEGNFQGLKPNSLQSAGDTAESVPCRSSPQGLNPASLNSSNGTTKVVPSHETLDIAITTNGHLLADVAQPLKAAGLNRVTVSMDAVDADQFTRITRVPGGFDHVLAGMRAARDAGLGPVKVNCVLMRGFNEDQIVPFGIFAREEGVVVRFIEFMPLEEDRVWAPSTVVPLEEILQRMGE